MTTFSTSRLFPASPSALFDAIQNGDRLARWWGPQGFANRFSIFEFQPSGRWVFDMVGPDGTVYPNESMFTVIEPNRRVVIKHVCAPHFELTMTLQAEAEGTRLEWRQVFDDPAVAQAVRHIVEPANEQNLDRLAAELAHSQIIES